MVRWLPILLFVLLACADPAPTRADDGASSGAAAAPSNPEDAPILYPDVLGVVVTRQVDGTFRFAVTLESRYDSPERYADAWRVLTLDGEELGVRILTHDHANEQPFTRSLSGVRIPAGVRGVRVQGRDQVSGWGGGTVEVELPD